MSPVQAGHAPCMRKGRASAFPGANHRTLQVNCKPLYSPEQRLRGATSAGPTDAAIRRVPLHADRIAMAQVALLSQLVNTCCRATSEVARGLCPAVGGEGR